MAAALAESHKNTNFPALDKNFENGAPEVGEFLDYAAAKVIKEKNDKKT